MHSLQSPPSGWFRTPLPRILSTGREARKWYVCIFGSELTTVPPVARRCAREKYILFAQRQRLFKVIFTVVMRGNKHVLHCDFTLVLTQFLVSSIPYCSRRAREFKKAHPSKSHVSIGSQCDELWVFYLKLRVRIDHVSVYIEHLGNSGKVKLRTG